MPDTFVGKIVVLALICTLPGCAPIQRIASGSSPLNLGEYQLAKWKRGVRIRPEFQRGREMYLWFYEWNLFDAFEEGELTEGRWRLNIRIAGDGKSAVVTSDERDIELTIITNAEGADLRLTVTNKSGHDWGDLASIVPCLSPGPAHGSKKILRKPRAEAFINQRTFFRSRNGMERAIGRQIYFSELFADSLTKGVYAFSERWPSSDTPTTGGLLLRESNDGTWVAGIEWEDFLSVQAHNPWDCMHVAVRVGALKRGETKTVRGRIHLYPLEEPIRRPDRDKTRTY